MKKIFLLIALGVLLPIILMASQAGDMMDKVYKNLDGIKKFSLSIKYKGNGKLVERSMEGDRKGKTKVMAKNGNVLAQNAARMLSPVCLFYADEFFADYEFKFVEKDERIKMGMEELVGIPKGQAVSYPQVRVMIKDGMIMRIVIYDAQAKMSYEMRVVEYAKYRGADFPVKIKEKVISPVDNFENEIEYSVK